MTQLSVNINKIASLRNARGGDSPNLVKAAQKIQAYGAHGITVHPRPDERHIKRSDVYELKPVIKTEYNIEGYPSESFTQLMQEIQPEQITLVPDPPHVITSNAGWRVRSQEDLLRKAITHLPASARLSVFVEPSSCTTADLNLLKSMGAHRVELYTEDFAKAYLSKDAGRLKACLASYKRLYNEALEAGLGLNAGHDLSQSNLSCFLEELPQISEVSIGHALISEALYEGLETTINKYLKILEV